MSKKDDREPPIETTPQIIAAELDKATVRGLISRWVTFGYTGAQLFRTLLREYALLAAANAREILHQQQIIEQQAREIARLSHSLDVSEAEHALDILMMEDVHARLKISVARVKALVEIKAK